MPDGKTVNILSKSKNEKKDKQERVTLSNMSLTIFATERIAVEFVSAVLCFVLVKFMLKPYQLTREASYLGLPLGFGFLGVSYLLGGIVFFPSLSQELIWLPLLTRTFAFVFLATAYFFSTRWSKRGHLLGEITVSLLVAALLVFLIIVFVAPSIALTTYLQANIYLRVINVFLLLYIVIYTLRSHIAKPDPTTIAIPFCFTFLAISQYSLLFFFIDGSFSAFVGSLITRLIGLALFLFVAYRTFYVSDKKGS